MVLTADALQGRVGKFSRTHDCQTISQPFVALGANSPSAPVGAGFPRHFVWESLRSGFLGNLSGSCSAEGMACLAKKCVICHGGFHPDPGIADAA